jgi:hypothetical protein
VPEGGVTLKLPLDGDALHALDDIVADAKEKPSPQRWVIQKLMETVQSIASSANTVRFGGSIPLMNGKSVGPSDMGPYEELASTLSGPFELSLGPINKGRVERAVRYLKAQNHAIGVTPDWTTPEEWVLAAVRQAIADETRKLEQEEGSEEIKEQFPEKKKEP